MSMFGASGGSGFGGINGIANRLQGGFGKAVPHGGIGGSFNNAGTSPTSTTTPAPRPGLFSNWFSDAQPTTTTTPGIAGSSGGFSSAGSGGQAASAAATPSPLPATGQINSPRSMPQNPPKPTFFGGGDSGPAPSAGNGMSGPAYQSMPAPVSHVSSQPTVSYGFPLSAQGDALASPSATAGPYGAPDNPGPGANMGQLINAGLQQGTADASANDWLLNAQGNPGYHAGSPTPTWDGIDHSSEWAANNASRQASGFGNMGGDMYSQMQKYNAYSPANAGLMYDVPDYSPPSYAQQIQQQQIVPQPVSQSPTYHPAPAIMAASPLATQNQVPSSGYKYYGPGNPRNVGTPPSGVGGIAQSLAGTSNVPGSYGW